MPEKRTNKFLTKDAQETKLFAKDFAKELKGGEVIALIGNLGSGKTVFTKGLAKGLGIRENITSPTFLMMKQYNIKSLSSKLSPGQSPLGGGEALSLIHVDCYRMKSVSDALSIGLTDYLGKKNTICVIEWAQKIKKILPQKNITVKFRHIDENSREITIQN